MAKVYFNGNNYAKLSGVFLTSLDNTTAIREWNSIPYLQNMYGADLAGFSEIPTAVVGINDSEIVSITANSLEEGKTYFPIYATKWFSFDGESEPLNSKISSASEDLQWLSGETLLFELEFEETDIGGIGNRGEIYFNNGGESGSGKTVFLSVSINSGNAHFNGGLFTAATNLLNGNSKIIPDWVADDSGSKFKVKRFRVIPRENPSEYKTFVGTQWLLGGNDQQVVSNFLNDSVQQGSGGNFPSRIQTLTGGPLKTPFFYSGGAFSIVDYYNSLGYGEYLPEDYASRFNSANEVVAYLLAPSNPTSAVPLPNFPARKYESTLTPERTGYYRFFIASDERAMVAIDNDIVAFDIYHRKNPNDENSKKSEISAVLQNLTAYSASSIENLSVHGTFRPFEQIALANDASFLGKTLGEISSTFFVPSGEISGINQTLYNKAVSGENSPFLLPNDAYVAYSKVFGTNADQNSNSLSVSNIYYSNGPWVYLQGGEKYRFRVFLVDGTVVAANSTIGGIALNILYEYSMDDMGGGEMNGLWGNYWLCANSTPFFGDTEYKTKNTGVVKVNDLISNVTLIVGEPPEETSLSDEIAMEFASPELSSAFLNCHIVGDNLYYQSRFSSNAVLTLLTIHNLSDSEISRISHLSRDPRILFAFGENTNRKAVLDFTKQPMIIDGIAKFR